MSNAFRISPPKILTVKSLRTYLSALEEVWSKEDTTYFGAFENQSVKTLWPTKGIGPAQIKIEHDFNFVILPGEYPC